MEALSHFKKVCGMPRDRARKFECVLCFLLISSIFSFHACGRHRVPVEEPPRASEKRTVKKGVYHIAERHQTLYRICKTYGVDIQEVAGLNGIADASKIRAGQRIFIPGAEKTRKVEIYIEDVVQEPVERESERKASNKIDFIWPVEGKCVSFFEEEERKRHQGVDISSPSGTPIKAAGSGWVLYSGDAIRGYGNLIILRHPGEWATVYAHNQANLVEEGSRVEKGQIIGRVGQTGRATGPHLHFEIRKNNIAIDPLPLLR